jgi:hypothetical protein
MKKIVFFAFLKSLKVLVRIRIRKSEVRIRGSGSASGSVGTKILAKNIILIIKHIFKILKLFNFIYETIKI